MGTGSLRDHRAEIRAYMAEHMVNYTTAKRAVDTAAAAAVSGPPDDGFGGHEFDYESNSDLFRCHLCREYEVVARAADGPIAPCTGLPGYGDDTERVYLLLHENPRKAEGSVAWIARRIRETGIGRTVRYGYREGRWLVESTPSVVDELERRTEEIDASAVGGGRVPAFTTAEHLTFAEGQQVIADNYAAYVAKYGTPR